MNHKTFTTLKQVILDDPLTESQKAEIMGIDFNELIDTKEAARLLGIDPQTLRKKRDIPIVHVNRFLRFKRGDVIRYRDQRTYTKGV